jgi:hypothetical protein
MKTFFIKLSIVLLLIMNLSCAEDRQRYVFSVENINNFTDKLLGTSNGFSFTQIVNYGHPNDKFAIYGMKVVAVNLNESIKSEIFITNDNWPGRFSDNNYLESTARFGLKMDGMRLSFYTHILSMYNGHQIVRNSTDADLRKFISEVDGKTIKWNDGSDGIKLNITDYVRIEYCDDQSWNLHTKNSYYIMRLINGEYKLISLVHRVS